MAGIEQGTFTATGQSTRCKCGCKNCQCVYETNRSLEHFAYSTPHLFSFSWFCTYGESSWWCRAPLVCSNSSQIAAWMFLQEPHATSLQSALVVVVAAAAAKSDSSALLGAHLLPICHKQIKGWCSSVERDRWRSCTLDEAELNTAASVFFHATALFFFFLHNLNQQNKVSYPDLSWPSWWKGKKSARLSFAGKVPLAQAARQWSSMLCHCRGISSRLLSIRSPWQLLFNLMFKGKCVFYCSWNRRPLRSRLITAV